MWRNIIGVALALGATAAAMPALSATSAEQRAKICAKAEERYKELYGKAPSEESVVVVMMYKYTFCPTQLSVKAGTTVRFVNVDKRTSHSVWFKQAEKPESDRLFPDETFEMTFDVPPGEYPYLCGPHWEQEDMRGKITVLP